MTQSKILIIVIIALLMLASACREKFDFLKAAHDSDMISLLPVVKSEPVFKPNKAMPPGKVERFIPLLLTVNSRGDVVDFSPRHEQDTAWARYLENYISNLEFTVAVHNEVSIGCQLGIMVGFRPRNRTIDLITPVDSDYQVMDHDLLQWTFQENAITMPSVRSFPSYFCNLRPDNPDKEMKFMIFEIELSQSGQLEEHHLVSTNLSAYADQLASAMLYSSFAPAQVGMDSIPIKTYLMVSFFPHNRYPTPEIDSLSVPTLAYHEALALRFFSDTTGIVSKPIPRSIEPDSLSVGIPGGGRPGKYVVQIRIDTLGSARMQRTWLADRDTRIILRKAIRQLEFYPAITVMGQAREFEGQVILHLSGNSRFGVDYQWLEFLQKPLP